MYTGKVSLEILNASYLPDHNPTLNTFLQIKIGGFEGFQTETFANSFNPVWNEYKEMNTKDADQISFIIYNDGEEKEVIAECTLSLYDLLVEQVGKTLVKLNQPLTPQGLLELQISLEDYDKRELQKWR